MVHNLFNKNSVNQVEFPVYLLEYILLAFYF